MTGMQKDLHEEFLQKISDMIQRDHVTASHEFRSIRSQLTDAIEEANQPKQMIATMKDQVTELQKSLEQTRAELKKLQEAAKNSGGGGNSDAAVSGKLEALQTQVRQIREQVDNNNHAHNELKGSLESHANKVGDAVKNAGGGSWMYVLLFQVIFVVALVLYRRSSSGETKQHLV